MARSCRWWWITSLTSAAWHCRRATCCTTFTSTPSGLRCTCTWRRWTVPRGLPLNWSWRWTRNNCLAFACIYPSRTTRKPAAIAFMAVQAGFRRQGVARRMMQDVLARYPRAELACA
ncbi:GNAT family N-acetyltransferase, partial [Pseudomonas cedrina subsp. fulgida]|nr:GNAT family N-acetyltransferase [Pseudomonas cedrina subsp. fulgida]